MQQRQLLKDTFAESAFSLECKQKVAPLNSTYQIWQYYRKSHHLIWNQECSVTMTEVDEIIARSFSLRRGGAGWDDEI